MGQRVLARWQDGNWWEGMVKANDGEQVLVAWADGSTPTLRERADVAPVTRLGTGVEEGELLVCKWKRDTRWFRAAAQRVRATSLDVAFEDNTKGKVFAGDCVRAK